MLSILFSLLAISDIYTHPQYVTTIAAVVSGISSVPNSRSPQEIEHLVLTMPTNMLQEMYDLIQLGALSPTVVESVMVLLEDMEKEKEMKQAQEERAKYLAAEKARQDKEAALKKGAPKKIVKKRKAHVPAKRVVRKKAVNRKKGHVSKKNAKNSSPKKK